MATTLFDLGFDDSFFEPEPGMLPARVTRVDRGACDIRTEGGESRASYNGALKRAGTRDPIALPCVGDWVEINPAGEIAAVLPRRTSIVRAGVTPGSSHGQVLAANVDLVYIAEPAVPEIDLGRIERLLALAWESGAQPIVLITKADLLGAVDLSAVAEVAPGAEVLAVSSHTGDGLDTVRLRPGQTAVLLGRSGAGKSSLVNALAGTEAMATQSIREVDGRGRHTTVHRELLLLPGGGMIIDTPGLRSIGLHAEEGLAQVFTDIEDLAEHCRFSDCSHESEPDCAVREAIEDGVLAERRLESWRKLQREAVWMASRTDARLRAEHTRKWKIIHKAMRGNNRP